jgi:hypothetical protein
MLDRKLKDCTHAELESMAEYLQDCQLDPVYEGGNPSKTDIKKAQIKDNF